MRTVVVIFVVIFFLQGQCNIVCGLKCCECKLSGWCVDSCGYEKECDTKYCTIYRKERIDPAGLLVQFYRACENNPKYINTLITTAEFNIYYRTCTTNLCNVGDGIINGTKDDDWIVVGGIGHNSSSQLKNHYLILQLVLFLSIIAFF